MSAKAPNHARRILVIDDDRLFCDAVKIAFESDELLISTANTVADGRTLCRGSIFDAVLLDNHLPDGCGIDLVPEILAANDSTKVVLATAFPTFDHAVKAIKHGAYDYISKPVDLDELAATLDRAFEASRLQAVEQVAVYQADKQRRRSVMIGSDSTDTQLRDLIGRSAASDASVLITGETGTGKNVVAKMIHHLGHRPSSPMITINCSAIPETLIESELFGVEKGAFTGANATRKGLFELADGGTLFLDEIGEMPVLLQSKLLSVIEDRRIRRVGSEKERDINVRLISATNAEPERAIEQGRFRSDLFYRLGVIRIHLPPLRDRIGDVPELCRHFLHTLAPGRSVDIAQNEMDRLMSYDFPGNVRELRNIIERALILQEGSSIFPSQLIGLPVRESEPQPSSPDALYDEARRTSMPLTELERRYILSVYDSSGHNLAHTAKALGISFSTLKRKLQSYGVR